jgi:RNA polymerase sigma-70 factor (ECF subfamily)
MTAGGVPDLEALFVRYAPRLKAFLRVRAGGLIGVRESLDDLAQSVWREIVAELDAFEYRSEEQFRAWLFLHATRKILDRRRFYERERRAAAREVRSLDDTEAIDLLESYATFCTPSRVAAARQEVERIERALQQLPERQRVAVAMSRMLGLSYAEIAAQLDLTHDAVRGLVARGLARLTALVQPES